MAFPRENLTGFDVRKFVASSGTPNKDPWGKRYELFRNSWLNNRSHGTLKLELIRPCRESWRYTGPFTRFNRFKSAFPGLGIATAAFAAYCGYEYLFLKDEHHGHGDAGHGEGHN